MATWTHDDKITQNQYDIFDSSPQRPLNVYGVALVNDSVDALVSQDEIMNSNKKREVPPSSPLDSAVHSPYDNNSEHGSKRHRNANWPMSEDETTPRKRRTPRKSSTPGKNGSTSRRNVSTPGRSSKFLEASMHDRPSNKPPSAFTRHFTAHLENASVDQLMDDYHEAAKPLSDRPPTRPFATRSPTRSPQRTHFQKVSAWSSATGGSNEPEQDVATPTAKGSGLFRFGKSMASAFNPVSIWRKVATTFQDTKEEMIQEKLQEKLDERYGDSREKAAQAYAALKAAGKLGAQGTTPISRHVRVYAAGYSSEVDPQKQRDSGISMDDGSRSSMDTAKLASAIDSTRKGSWHTRTPSFQNLKKMASMGNLHKRSTSGIQSVPSEKEHDDGPGTLRRSSSKLELKKQHKLSKRVSDLEAKLNAARRELDSALAVPAGLVSSRSVTPIHPLPQVPDDDVDIHHGAPHVARHGGGWQRTYTPALPTLLSERLLPADGFMDDDSNPSRPQTGSSYVNTLDAIEREANDAPVRGVTDSRFYMQPNEQLRPTFTFTSAKSGASEPEAMDVDEARPITPIGPTSFLVDASPSPQKMDIAPPVPEKQTPRKKVVIKRRNVDATYRPRRQQLEGDTNLEEEEEPKTTKKKQVSDEGSPNTKRQRASRVPISTSPNAKKPKTLTKVQSAPPVQKIVEQVQVLEDETHPRGSLETVHEHEEITTTTTVTVKDAPSRPTARATPAHPSRARFDRSCSRSRSRSRSRSPRKTFGISTPSNLNSRERRSASPPPSSTIGKGPAQGASESPVVTARPNGRDVPPMPVKANLEKKESFEWPDDVF
ncbi:hypothetical protein FKW77_005217 [Venturia effusa]|uniref:Nuclear RNA binding protein n=1 Tax=Venturia effusa TaxID=50376 RepID=A0A517LMV9_9PEZI|nr:hypothetical protein FKW77_005217 [Venturia effusa]